jgi:hypothetical protein
MHTISNKQAIANKGTARKESFFCEARAADLRPGKTPLKGTSFEHSRTSALLESVFGK